MNTSLLFFILIFYIFLIKQANTLPAQGECGKPTISPSIDGATLNKRIINGQPDVPNSWPWMASIRAVFPDGTLNHVQCIHPKSEPFGCIAEAIIYLKVKLNLNLVLN